MYYLVNPTNNTKKWVNYCPHFSDGLNGGTESVSSLSKLWITQLASGRNGIQNQIV